MADETETVEGSAGIQGDLWGERARDWADVLEGWSGWGIPLYRHVLERVPVGSGTTLLDVGCGAGRFCRIAADRGARIAGIDAAAPLVEIARERVPDGDFRVGEMEDLPWADDSFEVVTGFNSFFIAADIVNALREARRVARPGASVAMTVFGQPEQCESTSVFASLAQFAPSRSSKAKEEGPVLHEEGVLERLVAKAGLTPTEAGYVQVPEEYPDLETMLRGYSSASSASPPVPSWSAWNFHSRKPSDAGGPWFVRQRKQTLRRLPICGPTCSFASRALGDRRGANPMSAE